MRLAALSFIFLLSALAGFTLFSTKLYAQSTAPEWFAIPSDLQWRDIYIRPMDIPVPDADGTLEKPFPDLTTFWRNIPQNTPLFRALRINLMPGTYTCELLPNYWESRRGNTRHPILFRAWMGQGTVQVLCGINMYNCSNIYFQDIAFTPADASADIIHLEKCDSILIKNCILRSSKDTTQETLKINQCKYVYVEQCDISLAWDNAIDAVALQYGHFLYNTVHDASDWIMYLKGGSAYITVCGNEFYNGGTGGFSAGQGTGFQFMENPWIHYEAYDMKVYNNIVHDTYGAAFGVQGGYNIFMAHNTAYKCGARSHMAEFGFGARSCDGQIGEPGREKCDEYIKAGGWGTTVQDDGTNYARIPNKNVYFLNNILYNPAPFQSRYQHFFIPGENRANDSSWIKAPVPAYADDALVIAGNIIWDGPKDHSLGLGTESGCQDANPDCNKAQLLDHNAINVLQPELFNAESLDFRPVQNSSVFMRMGFTLRSFRGFDAASPPQAPEGFLNNLLSVDRALYSIDINRLVPGAYQSGRPARPLQAGLVYPADNMRCRTAALDTFIWNPVKGAGQYALELFRSEKPDTGFLPVFAGKFTSPRAILPADYKNGSIQYFRWRIKAYTETDSSTSSVHSFNTDCSPTGIAEEQSYSLDLHIDQHTSTVLCTVFCAQPGTLCLFDLNGRLLHEYAVHADAPFSGQQINIPAYPTSVTIVRLLCGTQHKTVLISPAGISKQ
jgi:hypothetical protein